jgi:hypothetical protein
MKRDATKIIWRSVVFSAAMLGAQACKKDKPAATTPTGGDQTQPVGDGTTPTTDNATPDPCAGTTPDPCGANPCGDPCGRPRGDGEEGGAGRGFILS